MPVARIISSHHGRAEDDLSRQLQAAGYEVELALPGDDRSRFADLEIEMDALPAKQALEAARGMARAGADVFVLPGALAGLQAEAAAERERLEREQMAREAAAAREREQEERRRQAAFEAVLLRASEEQERQRLAELEAQRRAQQAERIRVAEQQERQRLAETEAQRRAQQAERIRAAEERERQRLAALESQRRAQEQADRLRAAQQAAQRLAVIEAQRSAATRVARVTDTRAQVQNPGPTRARPVRLSRQQQWQRAAFFASLVVLALVLGFAIAMNLRPAHPISGQMLQNGAQQEVPFGAATITPSAAAKPPRTVAPASKPAAPRPSAAQLKPAPPAPRARRARADQEEVVVRHFSAPPPKHAQSQASVRHFSDEN